MNDMEIKEAYKTYVKGLYSVYYGRITAGNAGGYYVHRSRSTRNLGTTTHGSEHAAQTVAGEWLETAHITEG